MEERRPPLLASTLVLLSLLLGACSRPTASLAPTVASHTRQTARSSAGQIFSTARATVAQSTLSPLATPAPTAPAAATAVYGGRPKEAAPEQPTVTATAASLPTATATSFPAAAASVADIEAQTPPRHLAALAQRLRHVEPVASTPLAGGVDYPVGYQTTFHVADQLNRRYFTVPATVRLKTKHAYFYVEDGLPYDVAGLQSAAQVLEAQIYPVDTGVFGLPSQPGVDGDRRISIVNANVPGVGGYFSASDEYPTAVIPYSNQRNAIYINAAAERIGSPDYLSTVAHELQHMIHWNVRPHDDSWLNEGMSILAQDINGYPVGSVVPLFLGSPNTQLDAWGADPQAATPHYGAAYLFLEYFLEHYGGPAIVRELLASKASDIQMFDNFLRRHAPGTTFDTVFADWVVANILNNPAVADGRYAYADTSLHATPSSAPLTVDAPVYGRVHPYAARYYVIPASAATGTLRFSGVASVPLMQQPAQSGLEWWGNRADTMDTTLTRPVDLRAVAAAELDFSLWMDIEDSYDYFYVELSQDGGQTWETLPGTDSSAANPNGQNYGNGYTGKSAAAGAAPGWWQERVDLTPYAGTQALLRFEYVTDEAYSGPGVGLEQIRIPAIDFDDTAGGHNGWTSSGWLLTANRAPDRYTVQVIATGSNPAVYRVPLDAANRGSLSLDAIAQPGQDVVVAVSAAAPKTSEQGAFTLQIGR
jgi:immune inhibitor A